MKTAAKKVGLDLETYLLTLDAGLKRCTKCGAWRETICFDTDRSRWDGFAAACVYCRRVVVRKRRKLSAPSVKIHQAAVDAVRRAIRRGILARPKALPCFDCGNGASEYHHFRGYDRIHWLDVQALCRPCHAKRHW